MIIIKDVNVFERNQVVETQRLSHDQYIEICCWIDRLRVVSHKLPSHEPNSPGDTLSRILLAHGWFFSQQWIFRIDLFKKAREILIENNINHWPIDFDSFLAS